MLTKLEAVNEILAAIGEDPVASLESGLDDAKTAEDTLDRISKEVQEKGWNCNTETFNWTRNGEGKVQLPNTVLKIDTVETHAHLSTTQKVISGIRYLWNRTDRTNVFANDPRVRVVWFLPFDELSYPLQAYITALSARQFQSGGISSVALDNFITRDVTEAFAALMDSESEEEDLNAVYSNTHGQRIAYRHNARW